MAKGKEAMMNRAAAEEPKSGHRRPAPAASPGNERKADMRGAQLGQPEDGDPLRGASRELRSQHPEHHSDRGPHHGGKTHVRHMPLHGMHPKGSHGRGK